MNYKKYVYLLWLRSCINLIRKIADILCLEKTASWLVFVD
jgi:hypothetical protein